MTTSTLRLVAAPEESTLTSSGAVPPCTARAHDCRCGLTADHVPFRPHQCSVTGCMASWTGDPDRYTFRPITLPTWPLLPPTSRPVLRLVAPSASSGR